jgi:undecaprenyl-diphosphatase
MDGSRHVLPSREHAWRFGAVGGGVLAVGLMLTWWIAVDTVAANARDLPVNTWFFELGIQYAWIDVGAEAVSWFAGGTRNVVVVPVVIVALLIARQWRWAIFLGVVTQAGLLVSSALKALVSRERPPFIEHTDFQLYLSFPSGHTFAGITVWVSLAVIAWYVLPRPWATGAGITLAVIGLLTGPSRLILGKHWLTDVLGAWLVAAGWWLLVWGAFLWFLAPRPPAREPAGPTVEEAEGPSARDESGTGRLAE